LKVETLQTSFVGGEFSSDLLGRSDIAQYSNACETLENILIRPFGSAISCPGTEYINDARYTLVPGAGEDEGGNDGYCILLLHCDGENGVQLFPDSSVRTHSTTTYEYICVDTAEKKFGTGSAVASSNGTIGITYNNDFSLFYDNTKEWTIDFWVKFDDDLGNDGLFVNQTASFNNMFQIWRNGDNKIEVVTRSATPTNSGTVLSSESNRTVLSSDGWTHLSFEGGGEGDGDCYINGQNDFSFPVPAGIIPNVDDPKKTLYVGTVDPDQNESFGLKGHIDEFRISSIIRHSGNFSPPTAAYTAISERVYGKAKLNPFIFSRTDSYIIETGETYFRFYTNGAVVQS